MFEEDKYLDCTKLLLGAPVFIEEELHSFVITTVENTSITDLLDTYLLIRPGDLGGIGVYTLSKSILFGVFLTQLIDHEHYDIYSPTTNSECCTYSDQCTKPEARTD